MRKKTLTVSDGLRSMTSLRAMSAIGGFDPLRDSVRCSSKWMCTGCSHEPPPFLIVQHSLYLLLVAFGLSSQADACWVIIADTLSGLKNWPFTVHAPWVRSNTHERCVACEARVLSAVQSVS